MLENNQFSEIQKMVDIGLVVICKKMLSLFTLENSFMAEN